MSADKIKWMCAGGGCRLILTNPTQRYCAACEMKDAQEWSWSERQRKREIVVVNEVKDKPRRQYAKPKENRPKISNRFTVTKGVKFQPLPGCDLPCPNKSETLNVHVFLTQAEFDVLDHLQSCVLRTKIWILRNALVLYNDSKQWQTYVAPSRIPNDERLLVTVKFSEPHIGILNEIRNQKQLQGMDLLRVAIAYYAEQFYRTNPTARPGDALETTNAAEE